MPAHFRQRILGIQDQAPRDVMRHLERLRIDVPEQRVVDQPDEWRDAGDLLFAMRQQRNAHTSPVACTRSLGEEAGPFQASDLGRHMGGG